MPRGRMSAWPVALAVLIRLAVWLFVPDSRFASDEDSYYRAGTTLLATGEQDLFWPPGTGWLIAATASILQTTSVRWLRLVWIAFDIACLFVVRALARRIAPSVAPNDPGRAGRFVTWVTLGYALYLPAISFAQFTTSETPAVLLTVLVLLAITRPDAAWRSFLAAGALTGMLALTRPSVAPLLFFVPAGVILASGKRRLRESLVFILAGAAIVGGAVVRNWWTAGELTIARNSAYNFYIGNRDLYAEDLDLFDPIATPAQIEFRRQMWSGELVYPAGSPRELQREAVAWIAAHPGAFARRAAGRLARVFAPKTDVLELAGGEQRAGIFSARSLALLSVANAQWVLVLFGGILGLAALWRLRPDAGVPFVLAVLGSLPLCLIAISKPRYAFGFEPVLLLGAALFFTAPRDTYNVLGRTARRLVAVTFAFLLWGWVAWLVFALSSRLALAAA
jgi:4-amino-4-deoxy-L-arabinose transferase-like glycosyltransferase